MATMHDAAYELVQRTTIFKQEKYVSLTNPLSTTAECNTENFSLTLSLSIFL